MTRENAYEVVQRGSLTSWESGAPLQSLIHRGRLRAPLTEDELAEAFDPTWYLRHVDEVYARFGL